MHSAPNVGLSSWPTRSDGPTGDRGWQIRNQHKNNGSGYLRLLLLEVVSLKSVTRRGSTPRREKEAGRVQYRSNAGAMGHRRLG